MPRSIAHSKTSAPNAGGKPVGNDVIIVEALVEAQVAVIEDREVLLATARTLAAASNACYERAVQLVPIRAEIANAASIADQVALSRRVRQHRIAA